MIIHVTRPWTTWEVSNGFSPTRLEVKVSPKLQEDFERIISSAHGLPCAESISV
jgi:hypothetical protein